MKGSNAKSNIQCLVTACIMLSTTNLSPAIPNDLTDQARKECRRRFGGSVEFDHIDTAKGLIYCLDGGRTQKLPLRMSPPSAKPAEPPPREENFDIESSNDLCGQDEDCSVTVTEVKKDTHTNSRKAYMEQARLLCVQHFGAAAKVDHFDYTNWQVYCTK